jgi:hypothetical protein
MRILADKITKTEIKSAIARVRRFIVAIPDRDFRNSAVVEFDNARFESRDHVAGTANALALALDKQVGNPGRDACRADSIRLVALGEIVSALAVLQCNGVLRTRQGRLVATWDESDETAQESIRLTVRQEMNRILAPYGAKVESLYGDPRGHTVKLALNGASNRVSDSLFGVG